MQTNKEKKNKTKFFAKENWTKKKVVNGVKKYLVLTIANLILALVVVMFMDPLSIVSGGLTGISISIDKLIPGEWLDVILYTGEAILIVFSFIFLGKQTTLKSLYSCIVCPLFVTLFTRVPVISDGVTSVINLLYGYDAATGVFMHAQDTSLLILGALIGGIGTGLAVGLAFMVGGSTAGVDTIVLIIKKYVPKSKESILCFCIDSCIIVVGSVISICLQDTYSSYTIIIIFINIMTAVFAAGTIEATYMMRNASVTLSIISTEWEKIKDFIIKNLDRGCTIYEVYGGYTNELRKELKTTVSKKQSEKAKEEILKIDPNCFLTLTVSKGVFGEGFQQRFTND